MKYIYTLWPFNSWFSFFVLGWGKTSSDSSFSKILREAKMPVVDYQTCAAGNANLFAKVDDKTMLCAGYGGNSVVSGCHGDSGGPFVCKEQGRWVLRGAVSWGDHWCRGGSTFSVFARISTFVEWISTTKMKPEHAPSKINRGYYMAAWRYEIFHLVLKKIFQHKMRNFVSPSGHKMFLLFYKILAMQQKTKKPKVLDSAQNTASWLVKNDITYHIYGVDKYDIATGGIAFLSICYHSVYH